MTANELYRVAIAAQPYMVASHTLPSGVMVICSVAKVAGRSIVKKHYRTTWSLKLATDEYAKPISRRIAQSLLAA